MPPANRPPGRPRRPELEIRPPRLRRMTPAERRRADTALARLFAAMLADEEFLAAERRRQPETAGESDPGLRPGDESS